MPFEYLDKPTSKFQYLDEEDIPKSKKEQAIDAAKKVVGGLEAAGTVVAGMPSQIAGGLYGLGTLMSGQGLDKAAKAVEDVQQWNFGAGAYQPYTEKGKEYGNTVGKVFAMPGEYAGKLGGAIGKELGNEALGELSLKLPVDTLMNFLPVHGIGKAVKGRVAELKTSEAPKTDTALEKLDALEQPKAQPKFEYLDEPGNRAFDKIVESQISGETSPLRQYADPVEQMKQQLELQRQGEIQRTIEERQAAMEQQVARQQQIDLTAAERARQLEFNAAERARQEAAPTGYAEHLAEQERIRQAQNDAVLAERAKLTNELTQTELFDQPEMGRVANPYEAKLGDWRIDENGIPVKVDLSMEAANLEQPLQRNLWGDENPRTMNPVGQEATLFDVNGLQEGIPLTEAIDSMPWAQRRGAIRRELTGEIPASGELQGAIAEANRQPMGSESPSLSLPLNRGMGRGQRGAVNTKLLEWRDTPISKALDKLGEKFKGLKMELQSSPYGPEITIKKGDEDIATMITQVKGDNLEVSNVFVAPEHRGQGIAKLMYQTLTHTGNDVKRSSVQLDDGKAMWDHWEQTGVAQNGILPRKDPLTASALNAGMRRGQGGGIDVKAFGEAISGGLNKLGNALEKIDWRQFAPKTKDQQYADIPGMGKALEGYIQRPEAPEKAIATMLQEKDGPSLVHGLQSGMELTGEKVGSTMMKYASSWLQWADKKASFHQTHTVRPLERLVAKLENNGAQLTALLKKEMARGEKYTIEQLKEAGISDKTIEAYTKLRAAFDEAFDMQNSARERLGMEPLTKEQAYMASVRSGDYHFILKDKHGLPVYYAQMETMRDILKAAEWFKKNPIEGVDMTQLNKYLTDPRSSYRVPNVATGVPRDVLGGYMEMAKLIDPNHPAVAAINEAIKAAAEKAGYNLLGQKNRFMEKHGVPGFEGDMPWLSASENSSRMLNAQMDYLRNASRWTYMQEAIANLKDVLGNEQLQATQPNNMGYVKHVMDNQLGFTRNILRDAENSLAHALGISRSTLQKTVFGLKSLTYLQQLGLSVGYMIATPITALNSIGLAMKESGYKSLNPAVFGNAVIDGVAGFARDLAHEAGTNMRAPMSAFGEHALAYAEANGIVSKNIFNEGHTIGQNPALGKLERTVGATITFPEKAQRMMTFMYFAHLLKEEGKPMNEVFKRAEELTNMAATNFRASERPTIVNKLGSAGELAYTYKAPMFNYYNQLSTFARHGKSTGDWRPMVAMLGMTAVLAGALGFPGVNELDGGFNIAKDLIAKYKPENYKNVSNMGVRDVLLRNLPDWAAYGAVSAATGTQMSSRFAPNIIDLERPFSGVAPVITEINEQKSVLDFMNRPSVDKALQAAWVNSPPLVKGLMETNLPQYKGNMRSDGRQEFLNPMDIHNPQVNELRTPEEIAKRQLGLRALSEQRRKDARWLAQSENARINTALEGMTTELVSAVTKNNQKEAAQWASKILQLSPDDKNVGAALTKRLNEMHFTQDERDVLNARTVQMLEKVKRFREIANQ